MNVTLWLGPISAAQVRGAVVPNSRLLVAQVAKASDAAPLLARWRDADGNYIPGMLAHFGLDPADVEDLFIGSFSAGHNLAKPLTASAADRAMIRALMLADSAQSSWLDGKQKRGRAPAGYLHFAHECSTGAEQLFVASVGTGTAESSASSTATMATIVEQLEGQGLVASASSPLVPTDLYPVPRAVATMENFVVLDYQSAIAHEAHVLALAPVLWQAILAPWLERRAQPTVTASYQQDGVAPAPWPLFPLADDAEPPAEKYVALKLLGVLAAAVGVVAAAVKLFVPSDGDRA